MEDHILGVSDVPSNYKDATRAPGQADESTTVEESHLVPDDVPNPHSPAQSTRNAPDNSLKTCDIDITETADSLDMTTKMQSADGLPDVVPGAQRSEERYETDDEREDDLARDLAYDTYLRAPHYLSSNLNQRREKGKKRSLQASQYLVLVEDRLKDLEYEVKRLLAAQDLKPEEVALDDLPSTDPGELLLPPALLGWQEFSMAPHIRSSKPQSVIDLLMEEPYSFSSVSTRHRSRITNFTNGQADRLVERIRLNSFDLSQLFEDILGGDIPYNQLIFSHHLRPFKAIVPYISEVRTKLSDLEEQSSSLVEEELPVVNSIDVDISPAPTPGAYSSKEARPEDVVPEDEKRAPEFVPIDVEQKQEDGGLQVRDHIQALVGCLEAKFSVEIDSYKRLRSRQRPTDEINDPMTVSFAEMWYLFAPGDLVCDCTSAQALRIIAVRDGNKYLVDETAPPPRPRGYNTFRDPSTGQFEDVAGPQRLKATDMLADFILTCFHIDFDGHNFGPVQRDIHIEPFEGIIPIDSLPVTPIEYVDSGRFYGEGRGGQGTDAEQSLQKDLLDRGRLFVDLARPGEAGMCMPTRNIPPIVTESIRPLTDFLFYIAHRDYSGFSLEAIRGQIDSQVIVDLDLFYQKTPRNFDLGLRAIPPGDIREYSENYVQTCGCREIECANTPTPIFDDRRIDELRTKHFLDKHRFLVRFAEPASQVLMASRDDCLVLFPRRIPAFVLRSRTWAALDVSQIRKLRPRVQSFEQLVLPQRHKDIVEALVKTHSRGDRPVRDAVGDEDNDHREDLVRGKGKGVILLLHGVPGVGKTSTAECVAEYTNRPLFALTCGDIGDNAGDVQRNLNESFQLAHRWGCVMLLDEADVFLQSRARDRDLSRNAVVSVFLGMLEYYSGILFLTTNKIGTFDEAFKSRIHVSLYYKELDEEQTLEIWRINLQRIKMTREGRVTFDEKKMMKWMKKLFSRNERDNLRPWNGRQIRNACQTAAALAEFQNNGEITKGELEAVADASAQFDRYLLAIYGKDDMARAQERSDRGDATFEEVLLKTMREMQKTPLVPRRRTEEIPVASKSKSSSKKSKKKDPEPAPISSSSSDSDSSG